MLKALMGTIECPIVIIGLTGENVTRLMADEPVLIDLQDIHPSLPHMQLVLFGGRNDDVLIAKLKSEVPYFADATPEIR